MKLGIDIEVFKAMHNICKTQFLGLNYYTVCVDIAGCDSIVVKIRSNRNLISNDDFRRIRDNYRGYLVLKIPYDEELIKFCISYKPDAVIIYNEEVKKGINQSLNLEDNRDLFEDVKYRLKDAGISTYLSIKPDVRLVKLASRIGVAGVEVIADKFSLAKNDFLFSESLEEIRLSTIAAQKLGLRVFAAGNLNYSNISSIKNIKSIDEVIIGKALLAKSSIVGLDSAIKDIKRLLE